MMKVNDDLLIVGVSPFVSSLNIGSTCSLLQGFCTNLWHFLCTNNLHCIHLKPCRPKPQMRSWQKAQYARWNKENTEKYISEQRY